MYAKFKFRGNIFIWTASMGKWPVFASRTCKHVFAYRMSKNLRMTLNLQCNV